MEPLTNWSNMCVCVRAQDSNTVLLSGVGMAAAVWKKRIVLIISSRITSAAGKREWNGRPTARRFWTDNLTAKK